jgi:rare lipoprotein A
VLFCALYSPCAPPSLAGVSASFFQKGTAVYYSTKFDGRKTAGGERFDSNKLTAAHLTLPFGTRLRVTNLSNRRSVIVRVNDRGPYHCRHIIDLSYAAAKALGFTRRGIAHVKLELAR